MHSSRMRTVRSSSRLLGGGGVGPPLGRHPPGLRLDTPPPGLGLDNPPGLGPGHPLGLGLDTPPPWTDRHL